MAVNSIDGRVTAGRSTDSRIEIGNSEIVNRGPSCCPAMPARGFNFNGTGGTSFSFSGDDERICTTFD